MWPTDRIQLLTDSKTQWWLRSRRVSDPGSDESGRNQVANLDVAHSKCPWNCRTYSRSILDTLLTFFQRSKTQTQQGWVKLSTNHGWSSFGKGWTEHGNLTSLRWGDAMPHGPTVVSWQSPTTAASGTGPFRPAHRGWRCGHLRRPGPGRHSAWRLRLIFRQPKLDRQQELIDLHICIELIDLTRS